jgi:hypothetical protein
MRHQLGTASTSRVAGTCASSQYRVVVVRLLACQCTGGPPDRRLQGELFNRQEIELPYLYFDVNEEACHDVHPRGFA